MSTKNGIFSDIVRNGGRGSPVRNLEVKIPPKKWFFFKTKNVPYGLKCNINHNIFLIRVSQKGGWGVQHFWQCQKKSRFFWTSPLRCLNLQPVCIRRGGASGLDLFLHNTAIIINIINSILHNLHNFCNSARIIIDYHPVWSTRTQPLYTIYWEDMRTLLSITPCKMVDLRVQELWRENRASGICR